MVVSYWAEHATIMRTGMVFVYTNCSAKHDYKLFIRSVSVFRWADSHWMLTWTFCEQRMKIHTVRTGSPMLQQSIRVAVCINVKVAFMSVTGYALMFLEAFNMLLFSNMNNTNKELMLFSLISLFWKNKRRHMRPLCCLSVCVCVSPCLWICLCIPHNFLGL
jgi:hypothetical protein